MAEIRFQRTLRKVGGSLVISIPVELERNLALKESQSVDVFVNASRNIEIEIKKSKKES